MIANISLKFVDWSLAPMASVNQGEVGNNSRYKISKVVAERSSIQANIWCVYSSSLQTSTPCTFVCFDDARTVLQK